MECCKAHLEGFWILWWVMNTKKELYDFIKDKNGKIFIDGKTLFARNVRRNRKIIYGTNERFYIWGKIISLLLCFLCLAKGPSNQNTVSTRLIGEYNLSNLLSAVCVGSYFGVSEQAIKKDSKIILLKTIVPNSKTGKNELILDSYNANPTSMDAALRNFNNIQTDKSKTVILGDMFELGNDAKCEHQKLLICSIEVLFKRFLVGKNFSGVSSKFFRFPNDKRIN